LPPPSLAKVETAAAKINLLLNDSLTGKGSTRLMKLVNSGNNIYTGFKLITAKENHEYWM
jgi:hypothetical protein